ncbi:13302_t:CDS:1, partial [Gigaspora rosea]
NAHSYWTQYSKYRLKSFLVAGPDFLRSAAVVELEFPLASIGTKRST